MAGRENALLERRNTDALRGAAAFCMIFVHLNMTLYGSLASPVLALVHLGSSLVGLFFFYSGYTAILGFRRRQRMGPEYLYRRFKRAYIPYVLGLIPFNLMRIYLGTGPKTIGEALLCFSGRTLYNETLWYIPCILVFYAVFFAGFNISGVIRRKTAIDERICMTVFALLTLVVHKKACTFLHVGYNGLSVPLLCGMLWAIFEQDIAAFLRRQKIPATMLFLMIAYVGMSRKLDGYERVLLYTSFGELELYDCMAATGFALAANTMIIGETIDCPALDFLGKYSLEIYILHFFFMLLYRQALFINSDYLYLLALPASTIAGAVVLRQICALAEGGLDWLVCRAGKKTP